MCPPFPRNHEAEARPGVPRKWNGASEEKDSGLRDFLAVPHRGSATGVRAAGPIGKVHADHDVEGGCDRADDQVYFADR